MSAGGDGQGCRWCAALLACNSPACRYLLSHHVEAGLHGLHCASLPTHPPVLARQIAAAAGTVTYEEFKALLAAA